MMEQLVRGSEREGVRERERERVRGLLLTSGPAI